MNIRTLEKDEREFEEMLNETYGTVEICGMTMSQGTILKEMDPIAFRCALSDEPIRYACGECNEEYEEDEEEAAEDCCKGKVAELI